MIRRAVLLILLCGFAAVHTLRAQSLFWLETTYDSAKLGSANTDGSNARTVALIPASLPEGLALSAQATRIYWSELAFTGARILSAGFNLTGIAVLDTGGSANRGVAFDSSGAKVYWTTSNLAAGGMVFRSAPDGSQKELLETFLPATENPRGVAIDPQGGNVYWTDFDGGMIHRASLSASAPPENLVAGLGGPVGIALDVAGGKMYWTEAGRGTIRRANLDGTAVTTLDSGLALPNYLALDVPGGTMYWTEIGTPRIRRANLNGSGIRDLGIAVSHPAGIAVVSGSSTSIAAAGPAIPGEFVLAQNFPNPFNPSTTIRFGLPQQSRVVLTVFNTLGQQVAELVRGELGAGYHDVKFDANGVASGVYFYRIQAGDFVQTKKLVLLR